MKVADGVHHFNTDPFNWYVLEDAGKLTLVDAGFPGHFHTFLHGIHTLGRDITDIKAILLTHAHADHMGFADRVAQLANAPVFIHQQDHAPAQRMLQLPWLGLLSNAWRPYTARMLATATWNGVFSTARVKSPRTFSDGDQLDVPGAPRVIHSPGHTPGHVGFHLRQQGVLLSGDAIVTQDLFGGTPGQPQLVRPALTHDYPLSRRSAEQFRTLGMIKLLPGHGPMWYGHSDAAVRLSLASNQGPSPAQPPMPA